MINQTNLEEEVKKLRLETEQQLNYAKQQGVFWTKKVEQLTGSLAMCNVILKMLEGPDRGEQKK